MPVDLLTLPDLGLPASGHKWVKWQAERWRVNLRTYSHTSEAVGLGKKMESWRNNHSGALLKNHTFWFAKTSTAAVTLFLTTWKEQQQGQSSTTLKQPNSCTQRSFAIKGSVHSIPTPHQQNWWKSCGLCRRWPGIGQNLESFACRVGVKSSIVLCI